MPGKQRMAEFFYHHLYVFMPASGYLKYGNLSTIPFVYGLGNTIFTAYLINHNASSQSISGYFNIIPIAAIIGISLIGVLCFYISKNFLVGVLALFISIGCYYSISYTPILLAASFIGVIVQIFSIFNLARKEDTFSVALLTLSTIFSLFWNFEFGVIGFLGNFLC